MRLRKSFWLLPLLVLSRVFLLTAALPILVSSVCSIVTAARGWLSTIVTIRPRRQASNGNYIN
jgi:hypothetical protein